MTADPKRTVRLECPSTCGVLLLLSLAFGLRADAQNWEQLARENEIAPDSLYAPESFVVVDPHRTARRLAAAGERTPIAVRVDAEAAEAVVAQLNAAFRRTRDNFRERLESGFETRQLTLQQINSSRFRAVVDDFQAGNALFPVNLVLAQTWAKGYGGEPVIERLGVAVRDLLRNHHVAELGAAGAVWVVSLGPAAAVRSWDDVAPHARSLETGQILDRQGAGAELRRRLDAVDRSAVGFITGLLRDTLVPDSYFTGLLLADHYGEDVAVRRYAAGARIVEQGDRIDRWAALALQAIERSGRQVATTSQVDRTVARVEAPQPASSEATPAASAPATEVAAPQLREAGRTSVWPVVLVLFALLLTAAAGAGVWWLRRSDVKPPQWLMPAPRPASESMREALLPHLARELKGRLVQVLFAQRLALLENEAAATRRVEELEARLAKLQPAIAEKIRAYERRIRSLEREIEEKDQETRDLLRAKLVLARRELDEEIARNRIELN